MRKPIAVLTAACLATAFAGGALAYTSARFHGPGWYQVTIVRAADNTVEDQFIEKGPFDAERDCRETLKPSAGIRNYNCLYLTSGENW